MDDKDDVRADGAPDVPEAAQYYTVDDIAGILQLPERTIRDLLRKRQLCAYIRVGRAMRVRREVFAEWQAERERHYRISPGVLRDGVKWVRP